MLIFSGNNLKSYVVDNYLVFFHNYFWPRPWPQPPEIGLGLEVLASFNIAAAEEIETPSQHRTPERSAARPAVSALTSHSRLDGCGQPVGEVRDRSSIVVRLGGAHRPRGRAPLTDGAALSPDVNGR